MLDLNNYFLVWVCMECWLAGLLEKIFSLSNIINRCLWDACQITNGTESFQSMHRFVYNSKLEMSTSTLIFDQHSLLLSVCYRRFPCVRCFISLISCLWYQRILARLREHLFCFSAEICKSAPNFFQVTEIQAHFRLALIVILCFVI